MRSIVALCLTITLPVICLAQQKTQKTEPQSRLPRVDILKLNGSQPNLTAEGEGITSYKISDLFKRGVTRVKPFDLDFKLELPTGYTLFNNLAYVVDSEAVFSGPNDIVFRIPSASTQESFNQLRILFAQGDRVEPEKAIWTDITIASSSQSEDARRYLSKTEIDNLAPDFSTRTLHAFTEQSVRVFVVALKDSSVARDRFSADLQVKARASSDVVMEGREIEYNFDITNNGPDTATAISFSSQIGPDFISLKQSQGKCRFEAQNIYCNLGELKKGDTATITYRGRCTWNFWSETRPAQANYIYSASNVFAAEVDSLGDNNSFTVFTTVKADPNRPPVVSITKPKSETLLTGPDVTVNIVANAYDPDGSISEVEFFDRGLPIGKGKLTSQNTYELEYHTNAFGRHYVRAVTVDNQGRPATSQYADFIVNGPIQIQITDPKPNFVKNPPHDEFVVKLKATNPKGKIKKIFVYISEGSGSQLKQEAQLAGEDEYVAKFKSLTWECSGLGLCQVIAVATDDLDVETTSSIVTFRVNREPRVTLSFVKGDTAYDIKDGAEFKSGKVIQVAVYAGEVIGGGIVSVDFFVNGTLFATRKNERDESNTYQWRTFDIDWKPAPGTYTLTATAVDIYGAVGKSTPVTVVVIK
jgi:uncharacterized repeat protein (TIGR01451 family)